MTTFVVGALEVITAILGAASLYFTNAFNKAVKH